MKTERILFFLVLYGFILRIVNLGDLSFWIDESISALAASQILEHGIPVLDSGWLYDRAFIFHYIMAGFLLIAKTEFWARMISVFVGVGIIVLAWLYGKEYSDKTAIISAVLVTFSEIFIVYSQQARMYNFLMFFFFLSGYLLYKNKNIQYLIGAFVCFIIAYDTHILAVLLVPFFAYVIYFSYRKLFWWLLPIGFIYSLYKLPLFMTTISSFKLHYLLGYTDFIFYYAPFLFVALLGIWFKRKEKLSIALVLILVMSLTLGAFGQLFGFRYIFLAFFPLIIFTAIALSHVHYSYGITIVYILFFSNLFNPISYTFVVAPGYISHNDPTAPYADFRDAYAGVTGDVVTTFTPAAGWYYENPTHWLYISFTGEQPKKYVSDRYTNATTVMDYSSMVSIIENKTVILDTWGKSRMNISQYNYIIANCTLDDQWTTVDRYLC